MATSDQRKTIFIAAFWLLLGGGRQSLAQDAILPGPARLSAAQMLEKFGVDASQQSSFFDGQALGPSEEDVIAKILYNLPRLGRASLFAWRQTSAPASALLSAPADHRFGVFRLRGRAIRATRHALLPEQAELYDFPIYFRVEVELTDAPNRAVLIARHVPAVWPLGEPLAEPIEADALFLKAGDPADNPPLLYFAAERVSWLPEKINPALGVSAADVALAGAGFDIGLWDQVRQSQDHSLTAADREPFYQLLAALTKEQSAPAPTHETASLDVIKLLAKPTEYQGGLFPLSGVARRITRIAVNDPDVRTRFGIDHYFEIDLFLPLQGPSLRLSKPGKPAEGPRFENEFPATLLVRELPAELVESENVHQAITADAVFFKVWAYRSSYTAQFGQLQPSPLFIAHRPQLVVVEPANNWLTGTFALIALGLTLAVAFVTLWSQTRHGKTAKRRNISAAIQIPNPQSDN